MTYRVIALDLDGTLLDSRRLVREDTQKALNEARARGIEVIMVTGRHHVAAHAYHDQLGLTTPVICCNGTYVFDFADSQVLAANPLEKTQARALVDLSRRHGVHNFVYVEDAMTFEEENDHVKGFLAWSAGLPAKLRPKMRKVENFGAVIDEAKTIWKVVASHPDSRTLGICIAEMKKAADVSYELSWHNRMDISQAGNTKGGRLAEWVRMRGIDLAEVVAFGDSHNDISMLSQVGLGIAMGNSPDDVKACANWVTGSNDSDGIVAALRRFVL
jgi:Cof subfamily protein (haloacid dehalogenase superfamily)